MQPNDNNSPVVVDGKPVADGGKGRFSLSRLFKTTEKKRLMILLGAGAIVVLIAASVLTWVWVSGRGINAETPVATVSIGADGFTPGTIQVEKGQDVAWVNNDEVAHEVYALQEDAPGLDSTELLATGDTYIYTFEEAGTFNYYDPLNPEEYKGTVIVKD